MSYFLYYFKHLDFFLSQVRKQTASWEPQCPIVLEVDSGTARTGTEEAAMLNMGQGVSKASFFVHRCGFNFKSIITINCCWAGGSSSCLNGWQCITSCLSGQAGDEGIFSNLLEFLSWVKQQVKYQSHKDKWLWILFFICLIVFSNFNCTWSSLLIKRRISVFLNLDHMCLHILLGKWFVLTSFFELGE